MKKTKRRKLPRHKKPQPPTPQRVVEISKPRGLWTRLFSKLAFWK